MKRVSKNLTGMEEKEDNEDDFFTWFIARRYSSMGFWKDFHSRLRSRGATSENEKNEKE